MTKKVFYYYEIEVPTALKDEYTVDVGSVILKEKLLEYVETTGSKNSKILKDFIFANVAYFKWNGNKGAVSLEFLTERDWERHQTVLQEFKDYLASEYNIQYVYEAKRFIDTEGMLVREEGSEPGTLGNDSYWKTKEYFNETLPAERGFDTTCVLDTANGTETWMEYWVREK